MVVPIGAVTPSKLISPQKNSARVVTIGVRPSIFMQTKLSPVSRRQPPQHAPTMAVREKRGVISDFRFSSLNLLTFAATRRRGDNRLHHRLHFADLLVAEFRIC